MLHCCLEGIGATEFRVRDNEAYRPVNLESALVTCTILYVDWVGYTVMVKPTRSKVPIVKPA